ADGDVAVEAVRRAREQARRDQDSVALPPVGERGARGHGRRDRIEVLREGSRLRGGGREREGKGGEQGGERPHLLLTSQGASANGPIMGASAGPATKRGSRRGGPAQGYSGLRGAALPDLPPGADEVERHGHVRRGRVVALADELQRAGDHAAARVELAHDE